MCLAFIECREGKKSHIEDENWFSINYFIRVLQQKWLTMLQKLYNIHMNNGKMWRVVFIILLLSILLWKMNSFPFFTLTSKFTSITVYFFISANHRSPFRFFFISFNIVYERIRKTCIWCMKLIYRECIGANWFPCVYCGWVSCFSTVEKSAVHFIYCSYIFCLSSNNIV